VRAPSFGRRERGLSVKQGVLTPADRQKLTPADRQKRCRRSVRCYSVELGDSDLAELIDRGEITSALS